MSVQDRAVELVAFRGSRGQLKQVARELDASAELRAEVLRLARSKGVDLPDDAAAWPGKRLLRRARGRESEARVRTNPIAMDEDFECAHCGQQVTAHGRTARDHCPFCLRSLHVDVVPGDRENPCKGLLDPVGVEQRGEQWVIVYRCRRCGDAHRNRAILDGDAPDDWQQIMAVAKRAGA